MATIRLHKRQLPLIEITGSGLYVNSSASQINIGQGNSISVTGSVVNLVTPATLTVDTTNSSSGSHTHQIDASSDPQVNSKILKTDTSGKIRIRQLGVNSPAMPDTHSLEVSGSPNLQFKILYDANNYASLGVNALSDLNIKTLNNVIISPCANIVTDTDEILPNLNYFTNIGDITKKYLSLHVAEIWAETLVAQNTIATIGGRILVAPSNILTQDLSASGSSITVKYNNLFNGDTIYMEGNNQVEWMRITSGSSGTSGSYVYTVTRDLDGSGANNWLAGDSLVNTQKALIDIHSLNRFTGSEVIGGGITGYVRNSNTYNDLKPLWGIGNLQNIYGYGSETYGVAFGKYDDGETWLSMDTTNGFRIVRGASSAEILGQWTKTGSVIIGSTNTNRPYIQIDSNIGMTIFNSGSVLGRWTTTGSVIIGNSMTNNRIEIAPVNGISFYSGNNLRGNFNSVGNFWFGSSFNSTRIEYNSTNGLVLYSSTNQNVIQLTTTGSAIIQNRLLVNGTNSAIAIGNPPPTSSTVGTGLWIDRTGLYGLQSNVRQAYFGSDGKLYAGGGNIRLESTGLIINQSGSQIYNPSNAIRFLSGTNEIARMWSSDVSGMIGTLSIEVLSPYESNIFINATGSGLNSNIYLEANSKDTSYQYKSSLVLTDNASGYPTTRLYIRRSDIFSNTFEINEDGLRLFWTTFGPPHTNTDYFGVSSSDYVAWARGGLSTWGDLRLQNTSSITTGISNTTRIYSDANNNAVFRRSNGAISDMTGQVGWLLPFGFSRLQSLWTFQEGFADGNNQSALDLSQNRVHMTALNQTWVNKPIEPTGGLRSIFYLNGTNAYFYRTSDRGLNTNNWIMFGGWFHLGSVTRNHGFVRNGSTIVGWNLLYYKPAGNGYVELDVDNGSTLTVAVQRELTTAGWHFIGMRYWWVASNHFAIQLFLDGAYYNTSITSINQMRTATGNFEIGRAGSAGTYYLQGMVATAFLCGSGHGNELYDYYNNTKVYFGR
ncbi:MAG: hypothetical protein KatS3mg002_1054 [Candidatus Woesearchaeota archaeon]|nr:MAG: hypothetical protein KatS3mg002_1054 [Candidatus Woesearchaeota archaeon]